MSYVFTELPGKVSLMDRVALLERSVLNDVTSEQMEAIQCGSGGDNVGDVARPAATEDRIYEQPELFRKVPVV